MQRREFLTTGLAASGSALGAPALGSLLETSSKSGTFVHCVYFWLNDGLTEEQIASFEKGLASLVGIDSVQSGFFGTPAGTDRSIIDRSYNYGLVAAFENREAHDAYQVDKVHDVFREQFGKFWETVKIYDFVVR